MRILTYRLISAIIFSSLCFASSGQFSHQAITTNYADGQLTSTNYSTEINTSSFGGSPESADYSFYLGFTSFNLESATVSVNTQNGQDIISDEVEGLLLRIEETGNYDTIDVVSSAGGNFSFNSVFVGNYLVNVDSDTNKYVATYYGDAFLWEEADVLVLSEDSLIAIQIESIPTITEPGDGVVDGTVFEEFESDQGRVEARRAAKRRKCGLRRRTRSGRPSQTEYELIAYGETNDRGEFEYGFLPEGNYRFFVEYPGIPIDESSFVEFNIGPEGASGNDFTLAAFVTEEGISVELVLGISEELFSNLEIFPNPTYNHVFIQYDQLKSENLLYKLVDLKGNTLTNGQVNQSDNGRIELNMKPYNQGIYLLKFLSPKDEEVLTFRVIKH